MLAGEKSRLTSGCRAKIKSGIGFKTSSVVKTELKNVLNIIHFSSSDCIKLPSVFLIGAIMHLSLSLLFT